MQLPAYHNVVKLIADLPNPTNAVSTSSGNCPANQTYSPDLDKCLPNDPTQLVSSLYGIGLGLIGGIALLFIIYGGYIILTSQGSPEQVAKGKSYITYSLVGLLLAIFGFVFMGIVTGDILHVPGIS